MNWCRSDEAADKWAQWAANVLVSWCCRKFGCPVQDAEDAAQHALMKAFECCQEFRGNSDGEFRKWLMTTASRYLVSGFRKSKRQQSLASVDAELTAKETHADEDERIADLHAALARFSCEDRELIQDYYLEDLTMQQIASRKGVSVGTVWNRLHKLLPAEADNLRPVPRLVRRRSHRAD